MKKFLTIYLSLFISWNTALLGEDCKSPFEPPTLQTSLKSLFIATAVVAATVASSKALYNVGAYEFGVVEIVKDYEAASIPEAKLLPRLKSLEGGYRDHHRSVYQSAIFSDYLDTVKWIEATDQVSGVEYRKDGDATPAFLAFFYGSERVFEYQFNKLKQSEINGASANAKVRYFINETKKYNRRKLSGRRTHERMTRLVIEFVEGSSEKFNLVGLLKYASKDQKKSILTLPQAWFDNRELTNEMIRLLNYHNLDFDTAMLILDQLQGAELREQVLTYLLYHSVLAKDQFYTQTLLEQGADPFLMDGNLFKKNAIRLETPVIDQLLVGRERAVYRSSILFLARDYLLYKNYTGFEHLVDKGYLDLRVDGPDLLKWAYSRRLVHSQEFLQGLGLNVVFEPKD